VAKAFSLGIRLTESSQRTLTALSKPSVWAAYKQSVLEKVTLGAKSAIQSQASKLWKKPTGALDNSWFSRVEGDKGIIWNSKSYAYWLNYGVRPHSMTYLLNSDVKTYLAWGQYPYQAHPAIPLQISGNLAFRRPTAEALRAGKWYHPGFPPYSFVENGLEYYKTNLMPNDVSGLLISSIETGG